MRSSPSNRSRVAPYAVDQSYRTGSAVRNLLKWPPGGNCSAVWKNNGGGNYNIMAKGCKSGSGTAWACDGDDNIKGHGEVESESGNGNIAGRQDNFTYCG
jgi:hypothetical protein